MKAIHQRRPTDSRAMPTVLLVEDEPTLLEAFRHALEGSGYTVLSAHSGESAIRISQRHPTEIDVLVSDVLMRPISGFEVAASVKSSHPNVVVILMSGSPRHTFGNTSIQTEFLQKPFDHCDLLTAISGRRTPLETGRHT